ncbi:hypothetical protein HB665_28845 [Bacillus paranthracis]|uniref:Uncharacterized protein n=2 Tax=Bacillus cereus TaxID=1396 RepID=R8D048_BACCE|nr:MULTISPECIES: hypothetical protein [Bacillus cereus group]EOO17201.1 hypothetical protein IGA_03382 [Bacillus cereus HuA3-9]EOO20834.1 hypothetical protein IGA_01555 [Bacillus cereus HuA3-9]EOP86252.1 hypothetical protein IGM_04151 [Bacillus cereus HuB4-4]NKX28102.1 hypothetical protein [Bacillus paranthracis]
MSDINKIAGENIRVFIESRDLMNTFLMERTGICKNAFYYILNGKGNIEEYIKKLSDFLKIDDSMYFYKTDYDYAKPKKPLHRKEALLKQVPGRNNNYELKDSIEVFFEFVELIDVLKAVQE